MLEFKLFHRHGRSLVLTDTGRLVYKYADQIFGVGRELLDAVKSNQPGSALPRTVGVSNAVPQLIACRAKNPVNDKVMQKIAMFSNVPMRRIFSMHDRTSIYSIPDAMREGGLDREILSILKLHDRVNTVQEDRERTTWSASRTASTHRARTR